MNPIADTSHLGELIAPFTVGPGYVIPLVDQRGRMLGNNGDQLMHFAFQQICRDLSLEWADRESAQYAVIPPNGAMLDRFRAPDLLAESLAPFKDRPVVVFPSSAQFETRDPSFMFRGRSAPALWILRERYSLEHLQERWGTHLSDAGVSLALDHDVVISGADHVRELFGRAALEEHLSSRLLVARMGIEARDMRTAPANAVAFDDYNRRAGGRTKRAAVRLANDLPGPILRPLRRSRVRDRQIAANKSLIAQLPESLQKDFANQETRRTSWDLSDSSLVGYDEFISSIAEAQTIVSNRLHVAIPGALLGKRVMLIDSGYHKLRGIYEHSLSGLENIELIARDDK